MTFEYPKKTGALSAESEARIEAMFPKTPNPNTMHCRADEKVCRGESYCACQCDKCKAAWEAGAAYYGGTYLGRPKVQP